MSIKNTDYRKRVLARLNKAYARVIMTPDLPVEYIQEVAMRLMHGVPLHITSEDIIRLTMIRFEYNDTNPVFHVWYLLGISAGTPSNLILSLIRYLEPHIKS
jgi:hypothetical protein